MCEITKDEIDLSHLKVKEREELSELLNSYIPEKPTKSAVILKITLKDDEPVHQSPRRLAPREQVAVAEQVDEWLNEGIIRPSASSYASPIVVVKKKDGSNKLCVDFRKLNDKIVKDRYPLPVIEDVLEKFYDARVFTTLDLKNGFFHVDIEVESVKYTSFVTPSGQYEFLNLHGRFNNSSEKYRRKYK